MDQGKIIRACLIGLPTGILVLGVATIFVTHFWGGEDQEIIEANEKRAEVAGMMRKPVAQSDLEKYVSVLAGDIGERNLGNYKKLRAAAFWIESSLGPSNMGYQVDRQKFEVEGEEVWNVVAELPGLERADEIVVVGAHYDTVPDCPGANDNGTGVAALLALANSFSGMKPKRTIQFVAFVNEEPPYFHTEEMGSVVFAKQLSRQGAKVAAMISLETMGFFSDEAGSQQLPEGVPAGSFPDTGNFIAFVGNPGSSAMMELAGEAYGKAGVAVPAKVAALPESVDGVGWSDHWSFWQEGYPAMMVTDTAPFRYPHYHEPTDTPERIDYSRFTEVVKGMQAVVEELANP